MMVVILLVLFINFSIQQEFTTPGNFSDGTFGEWSMKRVPYPPPDTRSIKIEKVGDVNLVHYTLLKTDPLKSGSSRDELSVNKDFLDYPKQLEEVYFYTQLIENGIWFDSTAEANTTACVIGQFHAVNGMSPPIGVRIMNGKKLAISVNTNEGREYLYMEDPPESGKLFKLRFLINWEYDASKGYLDVFLDDKQIIKYRGPIGEQGSPYYYFKYGLYNPTNYENIPSDFLLQIYHGAYYHRVLKQ